MIKLPATSVLASALAFGQIAATLPAGAELSIRLRTPVSSNASKPEQPVEAVTIAPVVDGHRILLPAGAVVKGTIVAATPSDKTDQRASVKLAFTEIGGAKAKTRLLDVDNAREHVDAAGQIIGILASETLAARIDQGINKVAERNAGLAGILEAARSAVISAQPSGEIKYEPGVELKIALQEAVRWEGPLPPAPELWPISNTDELVKLVHAQPFQTMAENPRKPSDITNLMFIGTEEQLRQVFEKAGWSGAHQKNAASVMETVRAIAELRGYKEAPMSTLLLDGRRSDFDFQKQNNTFAKRHHLRVWRRQDTFQEKPVWVSSSTHDIGIDFSQENRTFIHVIDPQIDRERGKVVSDLLFTGGVRSLALVERPDAPRKSRNATGDSIETDGRMAVLVLQ
ncbi:MAG TPA: LssY C-terminal domain-containing protein [Bryobacteraceae bacterium]|nr:LssY C-terminal domain-containing protein [Bryobacteraceae bacterium]